MRLHQWMDDHLETPQRRLIVEYSAGQGGSIHNTLFYDSRKSFRD
jgi:hypothetical protein